MNVGRYKPAVKKRRKVSLNVTISEDLVEWLDRQVEMRVFSSRSHGIEQALFFLMNFSKSHEKKIREVMNV